MKLPTQILPTASDGDGVAPPETESSITSIENPLFLEVVEIWVIGSDPLSSAVEHLPTVRHVMAIDIRRDVVLPVGEDDLTMRIEPRFLRGNSRSVPKCACPISHGPGVQLSVLPTALSHRVRMVGVTLERRGRGIPLRKVTVAVVNEDRRLPRQHIVRVLRSTALPASSLVSAGFAFRWRPWLCVEIRGCCRRYCRQGSGGWRWRDFRSAGHCRVYRATVYAVEPVSPSPVPSSMSRTLKPAPSA